MQLVYEDAWPSSLDNMTAAPYASCFAEEDPRLLRRRRSAFVALFGVDLKQRCYKHTCFLFFYLDGLLSFNGREFESPSIT
jgi:hypothetical protein